MKDSGKLLQADCLKNGTYSKDVIRALHRAFLRAEEEGVTRKTIAARLRVSVDRVNCWTAPSHVVSITSSAFFELVIRDDVLPAAARRELINELARLGGFTVVDGGSEDRKPFADQLAEILAPLGRVADEVRAACGKKSEAGARISGHERAAIVDAIDDVIQQATELKRSLVQTGVRR
ncbi:MAG: hypothetical protein JSS51_09645 [Planctomycetes bacterium]|nr:hypothetical protein [Planctomycetota bacterium]